MNSNDSGVILLDRNNDPFFTLYEAKRKTFVPLSEIPKSIQQAAISAEDKDFYTHHGFSIKAIGRSLFEDAKQRQFAYGGSTLTQQLVKNVLLNPKKNLVRKYQELILANEIERTYNKQEILEMYLNSVYFGEGAFGVEEAAQAYFDKHAKDLTLAESAQLVALLRSPSELSPISGDIKEAHIRQKDILLKMVEQEYISKEEAESAAKETLSFKQPANPINSQAIHFALKAKNELIKKFGEEEVVKSGFKVKTTINLEWQNIAEEEVKKQVKRLAPNIVSNGAAVVLNPKTGEVMALVGSYDWYDHKFGKVDITDSLRQPGSSFKPIMYSAALEKGIITTSTILHDQPTTFKQYLYEADAQNPTANRPFTPYNPKDYDGKFRGPVTVRRALSNSLNVPAVEVISKIGVPSTIETAKKFGITTLRNPTDYGLSLALGAGEVKLLELTSAYATFANQGLRNDPTTILEIQDKDGNIVYSYTPAPQQILKPEIAFIISSILSDNLARSEVFGNTLNISRPAAVKTGTTENYRDAWTLGYTPSLTVGVWVGNNDGRPMDNIAGSLGAAPIWQNLMEKLLAGTPVEQFEQPEDVVLAKPCFLSPKEATSSNARSEYFIKGTEPKGNCTLTAPPPTLTPTPIKSRPPSPSPTFTPVQNSNSGPGKPSPTTRN